MLELYRQVVSGETEIRLRCQLPVTCSSIAAKVVWLTQHDWCRSEMRGDGVRSGLLFCWKDSQLEPTTCRTIKAHHHGYGYATVRMDMRLGWLTCGSEVVWVS